MLILRSALALALFAAPIAARNQPNVVIFLADDVGHGDVGLYDHDNNPATPRVTNTPVLDRMVGEGVTMTQFYANSPVCSPTRAALLTGRHSIRNGITGVFKPFHSIGLPTSEVTIAEMLKPLGYRTYMVGKWHLGHQSRFLPTNQGFDEFYGVPYSNDMSPFYLLRNTTRLPDDVDQSMLTQNYTTQAKGFISEAASLGKPFFLYVAFSMPHVPVYVAPAFEGITGRGIYEDAMYEMDWSIGQIQSHLRQLGLDDDTLIIFTSDNGACNPSVPARPSSPEPWRWDACGRNAPFSGYKVEFKEGGLREPFIARWPSVLPAGQTSTEIGSVLDILPTVAMVTGAPLPGGVEIDGRGLFDHWMTGASLPPTELCFYDLRVGGSWGQQHMKAMRDNRWKLYFDSAFQPTQLFNLVKSPTETRLASLPNRVAMLHDKARGFDCALKAERVPPKPVGQNLAPNASVSASSSVQCSTSSRAIDGASRTRWTSATGGSEWLILDLGQETLLSEAVLVWGQNHAVQYRLEVSGESEETWTLVHSESSGLGGIERIQIPSRARYVRFSGIQSSGADYQLIELALYRNEFRLPPVGQNAQPPRPAPR